eukprot:4663889-Pyramimonas_sp.AAC.1
MKGTRHTATHIATHEGHKAVGGERRRRRNKVVGALDTLRKRIKPWWSSLWGQGHDPREGRAETKLRWSSLWGQGHDPRE